MRESTDNIIVHDGEPQESTAISERHTGYMKQDQLLSRGVNDIISHRPAWIIRNGVSIIASIFLMLLASTWFVQYPDTVNAPMSIMAINAPQKIPTQTDGKLVSLLVQHNATVKVNDTIALVESANDASKTHALTAPQAGRLYYITALQKNQFLKEGQELFYVAPANDGFYGEILIPQANVGKLKVNQKVIIEMDGYPGIAFGYIEGRVKSISPFPLRDNNFVVQVNLPQSMSTNYGTKLQYQYNLTAKAKIITDNKRLVERLMPIGHYTSM